MRRTFCVVLLLLAGCAAAADRPASEAGSRAVHLGPQASVQLALQREVVGQARQAGLRGRPVAVCPGQVAAPAAGQLAQ